MFGSDALPNLLRYRERRWHEHCQLMLEELILPYIEKNNKWETITPKRSIVIIENRVNKQWLFTLLNSLIMCPKNTGVVLVIDKKNHQQARELLDSHGNDIEVRWLLIDDIIPNLLLDNQENYNKLLKNQYFWELLPTEKLLFVQTDSLIVEPIPDYFFEFSYLGAPFLPRQQSEYFEQRNQNGTLKSFIKVDTPIHGSPNPDVYPHLHGNGGLSIRHRSLMHTICKEKSGNSFKEEQEDVFFSRHIATYSNPAPLNIAKAFACESTYNPEALGSHAAWKYFDGSELGEHLEKHWKQIWGIINS